METECELMEPGFELIAWKRVEMGTFSFVQTTLEAKKTWWLKIGAVVYDSWKLQGDVEELWDELAKLGLVLRCCFALVVPRLRKEEKGGDKATWGPSIDLRIVIDRLCDSVNFRDVA
ncbi:hypothetical protein Tco_0454581 [Tanacetum coccineum]